MMGLAEEGDCPLRRPNEKALPPARRVKGWLAGVGGTGTLRDSGGLGRVLSSKGMSVEEGRVEEELNRGEMEELSWPPLEVDELFVPPLPL